MLHGAFPLTALLCLALSCMPSLASAAGDVPATTAAASPADNPVAREMRLVQDAVAAAQRGAITDALGQIEGGGPLAQDRDDRAEQVLRRLEAVCGLLAEKGFHKELALLLDEALVRKSGPGRAMVSKVRRAGGNHLELRLLYRHGADRKELMRRLKEALADSPENADLLQLKAEFDAANRNFPSKG